MDFIEITLENRSYKQPVIVSVEGGSDIAQLNVQLWKVRRASPKQYAISTNPEELSQQPDGNYMQVVPSQDTMSYDKLVLIITRLDSLEPEDPEGIYTITVESGEDY